MIRDTAGKTSSSTALLLCRMYNVATRCSLVLQVLQILANRFSSLYFLMILKDGLHRNQRICLEACCSDCQKKMLKISGSFFLAS